MDRAAASVGAHALGRALRASELGPVPQRKRQPLTPPHDGRAHGRRRARGVPALLLCGPQEAQQLAVVQVLAPGRDAQLREICHHASKLAQRGVNPPEV